MHVSIEAFIAYDAIIHDPVCEAANFDPTPPEPAHRRTSRARSTNYRNSAAACKKSDQGV